MLQLKILLLQRLLQAKLEYYIHNILKSITRGHQLKKILPLPQILHQKIPIVYFYQKKPILKTNHIILYCILITIFTFLEVKKREFDWTTTVFIVQILIVVVVFVITRTKMDGNIRIPEKDY